MLIRQLAFMRSVAATSLLRLRKVLHTPTDVILSEAKDLPSFYPRSFASLRTLISGCINFLRRNNQSPRNSLLFLTIHHLFAAASTVATNSTAWLFSQTRFGYDFY